MLPRCSISIISACHSGSLPPSIATSVHPSLRPSVCRSVSCHENDSSHPLLAAPPVMPVSRIDPVCTTTCNLILRSTFFTRTISLYPSYRSPLSVYHSFTPSLAKSVFLSHASNYSSQESTSCMPVKAQYSSPFSTCVHACMQVCISSNQLVPTHGNQWPSLQISQFEKNV